jgi:CDP-diacylglycerol--glycerol-3-phosphate 3-phosphatidyltransferase
MVNAPNILTLLRIVAVPFIVVLMYFPGRISCLIAMLLFILASLTDLLDGLLARRFNLVTSLGKFLDPLADKLLVISVMIMLVHLGWLQAWIVICIVGREFMVTGLRAIAADQGTVIAADRYGKLKTIIQVVALCPLILHYPWWGLQPAPLGTVLIIFALLLTLFSGGNYVFNFFRSTYPREGAWPR